MRMIIAIFAAILAAFAGWELPRSAGVAIDISPIDLHGGTSAVTSAGMSPGPAQEPREHEPLSSYAEIEQRMLFALTRRPPSPTASKPISPEPVAALPAVDFGQFRLLGVLLQPGQKRALIRSQTSQDGRWIAEGGNLDGVQIRSISADQVTLDAAGVTGTIKVQR